MDNSLMYDKKIYLETLSVNTVPWSFTSQHKNHLIIITSLYYKHSQQDDILKFRIFYYTIIFLIVHKKENSPNKNRKQFKS